MEYRVTGKSVGFGDSMDRHCFIDRLAGVIRRRLADRNSADGSQHDRDRKQASDKTDSKDPDPVAVDRCG